MVSAPTKAPPVGVQEYDFSYSVSTGKFRWRLGDDFWLCNRIAGQVWCRFANSKTDLALGHGHARRRIRQQQDILPEIAEIFRDRRGHETGTNAQHGRLIRGTHHENGSLDPLFAQVVSEKISDFSAALPD